MSQLIKNCVPYIARFLEVLTSPRGLLSYAVNIPKFMVARWLGLALAVTALPHTKAHKQTMLMSRLRRTCTHTHTLLVINVHYYSRACVPRDRPNALFCLLPKLVYLELACLRSLHFNSSSLRNPARTAIMCLHTQINSILHIHHLEGNCVECAGLPLSQWLLFVIGIGRYTWDAPLPLCA